MDFLKTEVMKLKTNMQYIQYYVRKIILGVYALSLFNFGVLNVPCKVVWGPDNRIDTAIHVPLWELRGGSTNGFTRLYQIDFVRYGITIFIISLIAYAVYKIFDDKN